MSMQAPRTVAALETLGRVRLSQNFFMRDFLYSEIANLHGLSNIPEDPDLAIAAGHRLCEDLLEPLNATFGRLAIRSAYRSPAVNAFGNRNGYRCASNKANFAKHIWDRRDAKGRMGATACIVIPWLADRIGAGLCGWQAMAWWIHDHLPYSQMEFFPKRAAFNLSWREQPERSIYSHAAPRGYLTRAAMPNHAGPHGAEYRGFPDLAPAKP